MASTSAAGSKRLLDLDACLISTCSGEGEGASKRRCGADDAPFAKGRSSLSFIGPEVKDKPPRHEWTQKVARARALSAASVPIMRALRTALGIQDGEPVHFRQALHKLFDKGRQLDEDHRMLALFQLCNPADRYARKSNERLGGGYVPFQRVMFLKYRAIACVGEIDVLKASFLSSASISCNADTMQDMTSGIVALSEVDSRRK